MEYLRQIDPQQEVLQLVKVHETASIGDISICYGSVRLGGEDEHPIYALYMIEPGGPVWLWEKERHKEGPETRESMEKRLEIMATCLLKTDDLVEENPGVIPVEMAIQGTNAIAAYLFAVEERDHEEIREMLGVKSVDTVQTYIRRYRKEENLL